MSETSWQRYAALAVVLTAALIEIFAFGGANTLLAPDRLQIGDAPRHGAAESFLEPIPERVVPQTTVAPTASNDVGTPGTVKRESVERKPPAVARATADHDPDHRRARVARRVVTYRTESQPLRPVDPRPAEPVPSRKAGDSNAQLNVKWEN